MTWRGCSEKGNKTGRLPLGDSPVIIGGTTPSGGNHLNVVYGQDDGHRVIFVMEPAWPPGVPNAKRTGTHEAKGYDYFLNGKEIILAWAA